MIAQLLDETSWPNLAKRLGEIKQKDKKILTPVSPSGKIRFIDLFRKKYSGIIVWTDVSSLEETILNNLEEVSQEFINYIKYVSQGDKLVMEKISHYKKDLDTIYLIFKASHEAFRANSYLHTGNVKKSVLELKHD